VLLRSGRLIAFSDSVLVVAVVLLVYNLATLATAEPNAFQGQIFLYTLAAYVSSFIVVFFYWVVFSSLLEYIKDLDDIVVSLSLIFLILVTLTPVGNVAERQQKNEKSLLFISLIEISAGLLLLVIFFYVTKGKIPYSHVAKRTLINMCVIPSVYTVTLFVSFLNNYCTAAYVFSYSSICNSENENSQDVSK
jgi:uncharacterized membrane protein